MVKYSTLGDIGLITFKSDNYNTISNPIFTSYEELSEFLNKDNLRAVILTGYGRHFCGGANLDYLNEQIKTNKNEFEKLVNKGKALLSLLENSPVPVASVVKGSCFGAGLEIALNSHFVFSSKTAMFGFPESELELMPGLGGTIISNVKIKRSILTKMILTGEMISSEVALENGIVDFIYSGKNVLDKAIEYLNLLVSKRDKTQIKFILQSINNGYNLSREEALKIESKLFTDLAIKKFME